MLLVVAAIMYFLLAGKFQSICYLETPHWFRIFCGLSIRIPDRKRVRDPGNYPAWRVNDIDGLIRTQFSLTVRLCKGQNADVFIQFNIFIFAPFILKIKWWICEMINLSFKWNEWRSTTKLFRNDFYFNFLVCKIKRFMNIVLKIYFQVPCSRGVCVQQNEVILYFSLSIRSFSFLR